MNKRFEELKRKAVAEADTGHIDFDNMGHTEIQMLGDIAVEKKFAQLIVEECAGIYDKIDNGNLHMGTDDYLLALQKHFGGE